MHLTDPPSEDPAKRRWGAEQRLEFIEFRTFWEGGLNRSDIRDRFGVSAPQASSDLAAYMALAPGNLVYDASAKRYVAGSDFAPRLTCPSAERYLAQLGAVDDAVLALDETWMGAMPTVETTPLPVRKVDAEILRGLLAVMRDRGSVEVHYQSMSPARPDLLWRRVTPHAFASDGLRWHVRAFCHEDSLFKDFVLPRVRGLRQPGPAGPLADTDADWNARFDVRLVPNPRLSEGQRAAVAWDYAMTDGRLDLPVRRALLYYLRKRLRLDVPDDRPAEAPVILADPVAFEMVLASAKGEVMGGTQT